MTVGKRTYQLELPFFVLATQNPIEMEGTYPLPEAQLDRFLFKLKVTRPNAQEMHAILDRTTRAEEPRAKPVLTTLEQVNRRKGDRSGAEVSVSLNCSPLYCSTALRRRRRTHPEDSPSREDRRSPSTVLATTSLSNGLSKGFGGVPSGLPFAVPETTRRYVRYGASPRAAQTLVIGGKVRALLDARYAVSSDDIRWYARSALRHRIILNFEGEAEGVDVDRMIDEIVSAVPEPAGNEE